MFLDRHRMIGILGGMGPRATVDMYDQILRLTNATRDQDHISTIIFSNPKTPDRAVELIDSNAEEIVDYLTQGARLLENCGADLIVMPCNTAHLFIEQVSQAVDIPVINMIEECIKFMGRNLPEQKYSWLLSTRTTAHYGLYDRYCEGNDVKILSPSAAISDRVSQLIYDIKATKSVGFAQRELLSCVSQLTDLRSCPIILGCTEIAYALQEFGNRYCLINPTEIAAQICVSLVSDSVSTNKHDKEQNYV